MREGWQRWLRVLQKFLMEMPLEEILTRHTTALVEGHGPIHKFTCLACGGI